MNEPPKKDPPIEPVAFTYGVNVVDIGDLRVARGLSRRPHSACRHHRLVYDQNERRIWCRECETNVEAFDAFESLVANFATAHASLKRREEEMAEDERRVIRTRAGKHIDAMFRQRNHVPTCPHCHTGIFPEDVFTMGIAGVEYAKAQRNRKLKPPSGAPE